MMSGYLIKRTHEDRVIPLTLHWWGHFVSPHPSLMAPYKSAYAPLERGVFMPPLSSPASAPRRSTRPEPPTSQRVVARQR